MLRLTGVSKRYGGQQALDGVSLHVRAGDCYGFLGHNGAGKTTTLRIALGLVRPDAGTVEVDGFDAEAHPLEARARTGGLIEVPGFHASLSGRRNLLLLARLQGLDAAAARAETGRVLDLVGLTAAADKAAGAYSQGMRQRLGIAQALLGRPKLVLLDEPTNGLDPEGIEEIRRLLRRLTQEERTTVLLSSHQLHELAGSCNRVGILRQGRMLVEEETSTLLGARAHRLGVRTGDDAAAARVVAALGLATRPAAGGGLDVDLGARGAADVARALVGAGIDVHALAPRETSLEEIYLEFTRGDGGAATSRDAPRAASADPPRERLAPAGPVRRVAAYDARRWTSSWAVPLAIATPAAIAIAAVASRSADAAAAGARVAAGDLVSTTRVTAFAATAAGLRWGMPVLAFAVATLGALSVAGELGRGTLRNVLLRPVGRGRAAAGKVVAACGAAALGYALLVGASLAAAGAAFDFEDLTETLVTGQPFVLEGYAAADLWPVLRQTVLDQAPSLAAFAALGVLVGSFARTGAGAVLGVIGGLVLLVAAPFGASPARAVAWDRTKGTPVGRLDDVATGVSNADPRDARALWVPAAWAAAATAVACIRLRRRPIA